MKMFAVIVITTLLTGSASIAKGDRGGKAQQGRISLQCRHQQSGKNLDFVITPATFSSVFTNASALGNAQLPVNEPLAFSPDKENVISLAYDWYFTATYQLSFAKRVTALVNKEHVEMTLNGDDRDGSFFNNEKFICVATLVKK